MSERHRRQTAATQGAKVCGSVGGGGRAIASAVGCVSPVIMTTRMPAARHVAIAFRTSLRGGSIMPTNPRNVRSRSSSGDTVDCFAGTV